MTSKTFAPAPAKKQKSPYEFGLKISSKPATAPPIINRTLFSNNVEVMVHGKVLIHESNLTINAGIKYFIMGANGVGKTTLMQHIFPALQASCNVLMIDQNICIDSAEQTIGEFILSADAELFAAKQRMDWLESKEELDDAEMEEYMQVSTVVEQKGWDAYAADSRRIMHGLGFTAPDSPVSILSGGKRMILAIGKALLAKPDVLMLDEPTNHLDLNVVIWLTQYLTEYSKTLVVVTHQIDLVNTVGHVIWYVGNPECTGVRAYVVHGQYGDLVQFLETAHVEAEKKYQRFTRRVTELKRTNNRRALEEYVQNESAPRPPKPYVVNFVFDEVDELSAGRPIVDFRDVDFGYTATTPIYTGVDIRLSLRSRIVLVGDNGVGKTTLFRLIAKQVQPTRGYILQDERLRIGYHNQQIIDTLPLELTPIAYLQKLNPALSVEQCRAVLGKVGIKRADQLMDLPTVPIGNLSGGQKARVSFACLQMQSPHLILLDEPTNHLDLESVEGLIRGINQFNGGVVVITHDMYFIKSIADIDIYQVRDQKVSKFNGEFGEYCRWVQDYVRKMGSV